MITEQQRIERRAGVGSSDSPIIMGFSGYKTPYQLYRDKLGLDSDTEDKETELQYWGNQLEPLIVSHFRRLHDVDVTLPDTLVSKEYPHMRANLDGWIPEWNAVLEVKCSDKYMRNEWGVDGTDTIPMLYLVQVAHQCIVTNADKGIIAVLIGGNEYREFTYQLHAEFEQTIIDATSAFWFDNVLAKAEPESITIDDSRLKYREVNPDTSVRANDEMLACIETLSLTKSKLKELDKIEKQAKMKVMEFMQHNECLVNESGQPLVSYKADARGNRRFLVK